MFIHQTVRRNRSEFKIVQLHKEYQYYQSLSYEQYTKIRKKQEIDFAKLMSCIIDKINQ